MSVVPVDAIGPLGASALTAALMTCSVRMFMPPPIDRMIYNTYPNSWSYDRRTMCANDLFCITWEYHIQYIPRNMHTVFALLCFVEVIHWLIFPYPSGLLHWHRGNLTIAPVPAKQPWWIWINTSCEFIMNDCITTTEQSTTKPCAYFLGYTVVYFLEAFVAMG